MARSPRHSNLLIAVLLGGSALIVLAAFLVRPGERAARNAPASLTTTGERGVTNPRTAKMARPRRAVTPLPTVRDEHTENITVLLATVRDDAVQLGSRRQAVYDLVRLGTDAALDALERVLPPLPPLVKAAAAEALGYSAHPRASALLLGLWGQADESTARSIAAALGRQGGADVLAALRDALLNSDQPNPIRAAAAIGLGATTNTEAFAILTNSFRATQGTELAGQLLEAIGIRPFIETKEFFERLLDSSETDSDLRIAAFGALNNAPAEATPLLLKCLANADPEVRSEAAWAISTTETPGHAGAEILGLLGHEATAEVRVRLYQALANQEGFEVNAALRAAQTEPDPAARMAAYEMLASVEESSVTPELQSYFEQTAVPALTTEALHAEDLSRKLQAVMILQRASSLASQQALSTLRRNTTNEQLQRALRGAE